MLTKALFVQRQILLPFNLLNRSLLMKSKQNRSSLLFLFKKTKIYSERANGLWKRSIKSTPPAIRFVAPFISKTQYFWRPKEGAGTRRNRKPNERERVKVNIKKKHLMAGSTCPGRRGLNQHKSPISRVVPILSGSGSRGPVHRPTHVDQPRLI